MVKVRFRRLRPAPDLGSPAPATAGAAGVDLHADVPESMVLEPGRHALIPTGIACQLPLGFEAQVRPRSGLAAKFGITVLNSPGTIDADYRGEIQVILINLSPTPYSVQRGDRIAQLVIARLPEVCWEQVDDLSDSERGSGGFGSTGR